MGEITYNVKTRRKKRYGSLEKKLGVDEEKGDLRGEE